MKYKIWPTLSPASYVQDNYNENWMWTNYVIENSISTYQVMFALTDLDLRLSGEEYIFHPTISKDLFSPIWTRPVMKQFMNLSGVVIAQILESDWYRKIPKTVMSIDHLAIPTMQDDVIAKGRIILYKESLVTFDEKGDSRDHKWEVVSTLARGMAYQAIDNAITLSKWSDLWFKTGLAALLHVEILNEIFPKWRFLDLFVVQVQQDCLRLDTDSTMKPLSYKVRTPSKIKSLFSFPIYVKAPVILRMTQHIMGKDRFQEIIKNYTKVESPTDLWDMQVKITDRGIGIGDPALKDVMATRITESNYPLIHVHRTDDLLAISQDQEQYNIGYYRKRAPSHLIPITFTTWQQLDFTNTTPHKWIIPDPYSEIFVPLSDKDGWIIVN
ncbi:hypothetical protein DMN91_003906 [Ooceraea biroi]|uniref:Peptidase M1 membrane alanine aminopeptidase domain-containing protein n=1 Tax=Ooceraea biroi TaxID=2015173 RepID=A0A3L8DTD1_OOCBI|nr:hypothetical protein DMN91_003906 [Ooceraea biroi]